MSAIWHFALNAAWYLETLLMIFGIGIGLCYLAIWACDISPTPRVAMQPAQAQ